MAANYIIKGEWKLMDFGHVYVAKAVSEKGRILAIVRVEVPLEVGCDFARYYGSQALKSNVESMAHDQVRSIADATPE